MIRTAPLQSICRALTITLLTAVISMSSSSAIAADPDIPAAGLAADESQARARRMKDNFIGWRGILFRCGSLGGAASEIAQICADTYVRAATLATSTLINLVDENSLAREPDDSGDDWLVLEVEYFTTADRSPAAISVSVHVYASYSAAQDPNASDGHRLPRNGNLVFWKNGAIGATPSGIGELLPPMITAAEHHIAKFFFEYTASQR